MAYTVALGGIIVVVFGFKTTGKIRTQSAQVCKVLTQLTSSLESLGAVTGLNVLSRYNAQAEILDGEFREAKRNKQIYSICLILCVYYLKYHLNTSQFLIMPLSTT